MIVAPLVTTIWPGLFRPETTPITLHARWYAADSEEYGCPPCDVSPVSVTASSTLTEGKLVHGVSNLSDNDPRTAWCEGASGPGAGSTLTFAFPPGTRLEGLALVPGYALDAAHYLDNARPSVLLLRSGSRELVVLLPNRPDSALDGHLPDPAVVDFSIEEPGTLEITVVSVTPGRKYQDLCISSLDLYVGRPI